MGCVELGPLGLWLAPQHLIDLENFVHYHKANVSYFKKPKWQTALERNTELIARNFDIYSVERKYHRNLRLIDTNETGVISDSSGKTDQRIKQNVPNLRDPEDSLQQMAKQVRKFKKTAPTKSLRVRA